MKIQAISSDEWKQCAEDAHLICFGEKRPADMNRISFALLTTKDGLPQCYMTVREVDSESAYMNYGGAFPSAKDSHKAYQSYQMMLDFLKSRYRRASTLIENTNLVMLKFAMKQGLLVTGIRYFKDSILLELSIEWGEPCGG